MTGFCAARARVTMNNDITLYSSPKVSDRIISKTLKRLNVKRFYPS